MSLQDRESLSGPTTDEKASFGRFYGAAGALFVCALAVMLVVFSGACDGDILCGVMPSYFFLFFAAVVFSMELVVTAVWAYFRITNSPSRS